MSSPNHANNANRRIDEELVSVDSLKHVLCTRCCCKEVHSHREQHDPPDFTLTIDGEAFPTEVTSIALFQDHNAQYDAFAKTTCNRAKSLGVLSGKYTFIVLGLPQFPKPTSKKGRPLLDAAVAYIDTTQRSGSSASRLLYKDKAGKISIMKLSANGATVSKIWEAPGWWGEEVQSQWAILAQEAVDSKKQKLQNVGIGSQRALLLLYDAFDYAEPEDVVAAMKRVRGYDWFHSVFWTASFTDRKNTTYPAEPGQDGFFLFSNNPRWNKVSTLGL